MTLVHRNQGHAAEHEAQKQRQAVAVVHARDQHHKQQYGRADAGVRRQRQMCIRDRIYPAPGGSRTLPPPRGRPRAGLQTLRRPGEEEWAWLRPFQVSDPPRSVAWKAFARGAPLLAAHYDCPASTQRLLDFASLRALPLEQKLSQLTRWVLDCERRGESYALQLPSVMLDAGHGLAHRRACLEALAQYGL